MTRLLQQTPSALLIRHKIYDYFFLLMLAAGFYGLLELFAPFAGALLGALICVVTFYPMYQALHRRFPRRSASFLAAIADILVMLFFVTPLVLLMWVLYLESASLVFALKEGSSRIAQWRAGTFVETGSWIRHVGISSADAFNMTQVQFKEFLVNGVNRAFGYLSVMGARLVEILIFLLLDLFVMLFSLFFMFRDGAKLTHYFLGLIPMRRAIKKRLAVRIRDTVIGVVRGLLLTALVQGLAAMVGYWIIGSEGAILLGALTAVMGLLPGIGTFAVSLPVALYYFSKGQPLQGGFLLVWGVLVVVGLIDTVLRPHLVGKKALLPLFVLFFALLGGVDVWGAKGIFLGPLLAAVMPVLVEIYRDRYLRQSDVVRDVTPMP